jgi:hypothetical protein
LETAYDWVTLGIFAGIIVLFLQRSVNPVPNDKMWRYFLPSVSVAVLNQVGNAAYESNNAIYHVLAILGIVGTLAMIQYLLRPFQT